MTPNRQRSECFLTRRAKKAKLLDHDLALRAALASNLLGANVPEQMLYPNCCIDADGKLFNGANKYILRFDKGQAPPVAVFWNMSMYDDKQFFIE